MSTSDLDDKHLFVLQTIETAIIEVYDKKSSLIDFDVLIAVESLISYYVALIRNKDPKPNTLSGKTESVFNEVKNSIYERILSPDVSEAYEISSITTELIVECLKKIRGSIKFWTKEGGRQGYLNYISQFL